MQDEQKNQKTRTASISKDLEKLEELLQEYKPLHQHAADQLLREVDKAQKFVEAGYCWRCRDAGEVTFSMDGLTTAGFSPCPVCNADGKKLRLSEQKSADLASFHKRKAQEKAGVPVEQVKAVGSFIEQKKK